MRYFTATMISPANLLLAVLLLNACTTVQFKDVAIEKMEKVETSAQPELKGENLAYIGPQVLKVSFTSKTDFSDYGIKKLKLKGPLYLHAEICDSIQPLAGLYNGVESIETALPKLYSDSVALNSHDSPTDRLDALDTDLPKTYYFYVITRKDEKFSRYRMADVRVQYNLAERPRDLCFRMLVMNGYGGAASKRVKIEKDKVGKALE